MEHTHLELTLVHGPTIVLPIEGMVVMEQKDKGTGIHYTAKHGGWEVKESYKTVTKWLRIANRKDGK